MPPRFHSPPNWPRPPEDWVPPQGWQPDPRWGPAPPGWTFWVARPEPEPVPEPEPAGPPVERPPGGPRVFISYRRSDCQPQANGLYDGLTHRLPSASIFMDIDSIPPGADFEQHIRQEIQICDLVLVLIGDNWLDRAPGESGRRIDAPDDFVRLEIESALASPRVRVLPVLVEGASMPRVADLPPSVRGLARFNAMELDDRRWTADLRRLTATVEQLTQHVEPVPATDLPSGPAQPVVDRGRVDGRRGSTTARPAGPRTPVAGWIMIGLPVLTFGFANFVPGLWAAVRRWADKRFRVSMLVFAGVVGVITYTSIAVVGSTPAGVLSNVGILTWLAAIVVATVVAVLHRKSPTDLPGAAEELRRRRERDHYRGLARRDPSLARSMGVGRPDLNRTYSDGGLLDVNALSADALASFVPMSGEEARRLVQLRDHRGRLNSIDDLGAARLPEPASARLRETAIFL